MTGSGNLSRNFYKHIKRRGLEARTSLEWDRSIVKMLTAIFSPDVQILDVGCGYGRIAIPLAELGYQIKGLDLSPQLIAEAQEEATKRGLDIEFSVGSMTEMPYSDASFDAALCLWSAFNELLDVSEQAKALQEMYRILRPSGRAVIEGSIFEEATEEEIRTGRRRGPGNRISWDVIEGLPNPHYRHDPKSLADLCLGVGITGYEIVERHWAGRPRQVLVITKQQPAVGGSPLAN